MRLPPLPQPRPAGGSLRRPALPPQPRGLPPPGAGAGGRGRPWPAGKPAHPQRERAAAPAPPQPRSAGGGFRPESLRGAVPGGLPQPRPLRYRSAEPEQPPPPPVFSPNFPCQTFPAAAGDAAPAPDPAAEASAPAQAPRPVSPPRRKRINKVADRGGGAVCVWKRRIAPGSRRQRGCKWLRRCQRLAPAAGPGAGGRAPRISCRSVRPPPPTPPRVCALGPSLGTGAAHPRRRPALLPRSRSLTRTRIYPCVRLSRSLPEVSACVFRLLRPEI